MAKKKQQPVINEIANAGADFDIFQGFLGTLANPDKVLALECGGDISIYDDIGRDPRVAASLRTRALAVIGKEWDVVPFSQEPIDLKVAEYVKKVFLSFPHDRARRSLLRGGTLKGFAVSEVMWEVSEGDVFISDMRYRHQRRFQFNQESHLLLLTHDHPMGLDVTVRDGLPLNKFQVVTFGDEVETPYGIGLGRELYWPWWFKKNDIKFWLTFCDKWASPTVRGEYEAGALPADQDKLLAAASAVHSNAAIIHPKGMSLSLLESARSGSVATYRELVEFMNSEMTIAILGQTATTQGTPGSLGNQDAQADVRADLVKADADALCEALNPGVVRWLVDYQFPGHGRYPQIWIDCAEEEDKKTLAERDDKLSASMEKSGLRLTQKYYCRTHGLTEDDIEVTPKPATPTPPAAPTFAEPTTVGANNDSPALALDAVDTLVNENLSDWQPIMDGLLNPFKAILDKAIAEGWTPTQLRDGLPDLFAAMDSDPLHASLASATLQARALGDATDEI